MEEFIEIFTQYGADITIIAVICAAIVQICKRTFLKNVPKKFITFAPFIVGVILYAVYADAMNLNFLYAFIEIQEILEQGFAVGTLATLLYVLYEQFVRGEDADEGGDGGTDGGDDPDGFGGEADAGEIFCEERVEEVQGEITVIS